MSYPGLNSPEIFLMIVGLLAELVAFVFYKRFKLKARRLARTGRMTDIEIAHNWQWFFGIALIAIPTVVYMMH